MELAGRVGLAPMAGVSDAPFRALCLEQGAALVYTEMVSARGLCYSDKKTAELLYVPERGHPVAAQIFGHEPEVMARGARLALEISGADILDLNMGCPASNVTRGGAGSALMRDLRHAEACVAAVVRAVKVPVTVKMRAGWDAAQKERGDFLDFLRMFEANGVQALTLHPRTRAQQYSGEADWSLIARAVELGPAYPVIGNGDVVEAEDARRMLRETGCRGVMVGRGALFNPFLFRQILEPELTVTPGMRVDLLLRLLERLQVELEPREALHKVKKLGGWITKGIPGGSAFRHQLHEKNDPEALMTDLLALRARLEGDAQR